MVHKFGVNISGYINKQFGLGQGVRANINSVEAAGIPYVLNDFNIEIPIHIQDSKENITTSANPFFANLVQINIDNLYQIITTENKDYFFNKYNIGFWVWELEEFPEESKKYFDFFDEIWVPSNFCAEAISRVSPVPVLKIMHSIDIKEHPFSRKDFGIPEDKFVFLSIFDYYSSFSRKNPLGVVEAYEKAFGKNNPDVIQVLKSSISQEFPEEKKRILDRISGNSSIILIEEVLPQDKLNSLYNCCDCYVSLHRSEGFGLTMAEAMFLGKPVIATAYSANTEFMNINNSFPVRYKMVSTGDAYAFAGGKGHWADPNLLHAAELMKFVVENPEKSKEIAIAGQNDVKEILSPKRIGEKINNRLEFIYSDLLPKKGLAASGNESLLKLEIEQMQAKIDKLKSYLPIQMKLKIKNLKNRLTGSERKYMWED